jgi:hypothetical protein
MAITTSHQRSILKIRKNIPDHISESSETLFWVKIIKSFDADPGIF